MKNFIKLLFLVLPIFMSCSSSSEKTTTQAQQEEKKANLPFVEYEQKVTQNIGLLPPDKKVLRDSIITALKANPIYNDLVTAKAVSQKYLPFFTAINVAVQSVGTNGFEIPESIYQVIEKDTNSTNFVMNCVMLVLKGGLTRELIDVCDRYLTKYKFYGKKGNTFFDASGTSKEVIENDYNLTAVACMLAPTNKEYLEAFYKSYFAELTNFTAEGEGYFYPFLAKKQEFFSYLQTNQIESRYNYAKFAKSGDVVKAGYFEVQVTNLKSLPQIKTPFKTYQNEGGFYIIVSAKYKNIDNESSTATQGKLILVNDSDKEYIFDKSEIIMEAKYNYLLLEKINPLSSKTYDFIYAVPNGRYDVFWAQGAGNPIYLGAIE